MKNVFWPALLMSVAVLLGGCVTRIKTDITQNPPPTEKFASFTQFQLAPVAIAPAYASHDANQKALVRIQENVLEKMTPLLAQWNAIGAAHSPTRTLVIEPVITDIKFINATARVWAGAFAGSSAVVLKARITEKETGRVVAEPTFYARAAAMGGAWTFGSTDNVMLIRIAGRLADYLTLNYNSAVGGPTGMEPAKNAP
jgi:hypothetical protein